MTKTYALHKLLEHGPLTFSELKEITGWDWNSVRGVIARMSERGEIDVVVLAPRRHLYRLA